MGNELVPERRLNKLGHLVTKHVKVFDARKDSAVEIPPPVVAPAPVAADDDARSKLARDAAAAIAETMNRRSDGTSATLWHLNSNLHRVISSYAASTLERILTLDSAFHTQIGAVLLGGRSESFINDFLVLNKSVLKPQWWSSGDTQRYLEALPYYDGLTPVGENGEYPAERYEQCKALYTVTMHCIDRGEVVREFKGNGREACLIKDEKLRDLILDSETDRDAVVQIITERDIFDADHIRELMDDVHPTLMDGGL